MKHLVCMQCFAKTLQLSCLSSFVAACVLPLILMPLQLTTVCIKVALNQVEHQATLLNTTFHVQE